MVFLRSFDNLLANWGENFETKWDC